MTQLKKIGSVILSTVILFTVSGWAPDVNAIKDAQKLTSLNTLIETQPAYPLLFKTAPIRFKTIFKHNPKLRATAPKLVQKGHDGLKTKCFIMVSDGKGHEKPLLVSVQSTPAQNAVYVTGGTRTNRMALASRGGFVRSKTLIMIATAYDPGPRSCGRGCTGRTATGLRAGYGVVAVDPRVIRLGTKLYIEGYGYAIAGDTGGAIKGRRIDLGKSSYREALRFGRRKVKVHILRSGR